MDFTPAGLADYFWKSPMGVKLRADAATERREQRAAAEKSLVDLAAKEHKELGRLAAVKAAANAEFFRARDALRLAERKRSTASYELMGAAHAFENKRAQHEKFLRDTAAGELRPFLDKLEAARQPVPIAELFQAEMKIEHYDFAPPRPVCVRSNESQLRERAAAISAAEREGQRLAESKAEITADLNRLEKSIPDWRLPVKV